MAGFNKVIMVGNLTRDPELRHLDSGTAVAKLGLAISRSYTTQSGDRREEVCFIDVTVWNRLAEICSEYLTKGRRVLVEGRLKFDRWENEAGEPRSKHEIVADTVRFLDSPRDREGGFAREEGEGGYARSDPSVDPPNRGGGGGGYERSGGGRREEPSDEPIDDDIPF